MNKEKIKCLFWSVIALSFVTIVITFVSFLRMNLKLGFIFLLLSAVMLLINYLCEYSLLKKEYKDDTTSLSLPSLLKKGNSINPNSSRGKIVWFMKFIFPLALSLACIFALIVFYSILFYSILL
ncbi:hypothetical protein [Lactococcus lactis]|uniref:hypothetical protein n=1 Tax=Lactococcus lactis TaxID=1358 RepID=UPI001F589E1C|nr:hypothetical protein [Lactococcus lactis]